MKTIKKIGVFLIIISCMMACKNQKKEEKSEQQYQCPMKCEGEKVFTAPGTCKVCKMDLKAIDKNNKIEKSTKQEFSETSIFNLSSKWNTEEGKVIELKDLKGKTLVMVMIYTNCKAACPRLVADMRNIEKQIPNNDNVSYVLISIDPKTDTPKRLKEFAIENKMDAEHWTFLQGTESSVREFANVLAVKYKQISPLDFSHSNIISVFNPQGDLAYQQEGLGVDNKEIISKIKELTK